MEEPLLERLTEGLTQAPPMNVHLNGHGETTYHRGWASVARRLLDAGHRLHIITNLAKPYSDDEIALLSRFAAVQVSLDSHDEAMMRRIRKAVRVSHVMAQIARIRAVARQEGRAAPLIAFSVGIYDPSIWTLDDFAAFLIEAGVGGVTFWSLVEHGHQKLVRPLAALPPRRKVMARRILVRTRRRLKGAGVATEFAGGFGSFLP